MTIEDLLDILEPVTRNNTKALIRRLDRLRCKVLMNRQRHVAEKIKHVMDIPKKDHANKDCLILVESEDT